ncbi:unnamed protein product [Moneuplotes crassus]|uniref:Uncharacterized protein n=3 Tax=Euplotes crassus TaxID=5936 RepID=A0AAD1XP82_EUPCR|nr:unnamed protein product [Moneuplotes crassus]
MSIVDKEYLEYKDRANSNISKSKRKIDQLKEQLASMSLNSISQIADHQEPQHQRLNSRGQGLSSDQNPAIHDGRVSHSIFQESPVRQKEMGNTYDRQEMGTDEKMLRENFDFETQEQFITNEIREVTRDRLGSHSPDYSDKFEQQDNPPIDLLDEEQLVRTNTVPLETAERHFVQEEAKSFKNKISSTVQAKIANNSENPELTLLRTNLKDKIETWRSLKNRILGGLSTFQEKRAEYENIQNYFKNRVVEAGETEALLKNELNQVRERLSTIKVIKKRQKKMSARNKKKWLESLRKLTHDIENLKVKKKTVEESISKIRQEAEDLHTFEMKKFKEVLAETERALDKIEGERKRDEARLEELEASLSELRQEYSSMVDAKALKEKCIHETQQRIKMLEADIRNYEKANPLIVEKYQSKASLKQDLDNLNAKIKKMQVQVDSINQDRVYKQMRVDKENENIQKNEEEIEKLTSQIEVLKTEHEENIKRIEVYFNRKRRETGMDTPHVYVHDLVKRLDTITIGDEVRIKEGEVLSKIRASLLDNVKRTIGVLDEQIKEKSMDLLHVRETLKEQSRHHQEENEHSSKLQQTLIKKFKILVHEFRDLKIKKYKTELRLKHRSIAIDKFIYEQKSKIPELERTIYFNLKFLPTDQDIVDHIINEQHTKPGCVTQEEALPETVFSFYKLIKARESKIQELSEKRSNCHFLIRESKEILEGISIGSNSEELYYQRKAQLTDLKIQASKLQTKFGEVSATLELELFDIGNKNFKTYYKKSLHDVARKMDKVYGTKPLNQFKGKHKRDVTDSSHMLEVRRIQNYQAALRLLDESREQVERLEADIKTHVSESLQNLRNKISCEESKISKIKKQYTAVVDAEKQLHKHIKAAIMYKELEIKQKTQSLYLERKLTHVEEELETVEKEIHENTSLHNQKLNETFIDDGNDTLSNNESMSQHDAELEIEQEEVAMKQKESQLIDAISKLETEISPNLRKMNAERDSLEVELVSIKAKVETQYLRYNEVREMIDGLKEAIEGTQQAELPPSEIGSFDGPSVRDKVDSEIELMRENKKSEAFRYSKHVDISTVLSSSQIPNKPQETIVVEESQILPPAKASQLA